jgi:hypothetical protein
VFGAWVLVSIAQLTWINSVIKLFEPKEMFPSVPKWSVKYLPLKILPTKNRQGSFQRNLLATVWRFVDQSDVSVYAEYGKGGGW